MTSFPLASLSRSRLETLIAGFSSLRIVVAGDFFLDRYWEVEPQWEELSVETGKPAHQIAAVRSSPGAAGTVAANLAALGVDELHAVGMTGDDGESYELRRGLACLGCSTDHLHLEPRRRTPTYTKPRDRGRTGLAGEHSRYDIKNRQPTPEETQSKIIASLRELIPRADAVVVLDQTETPECGGVTSAVRETLAELASEQPNVLFWADSRRRIDLFRRLHIKPNQFEALGRDCPAPEETASIEEVAKAAQTLRKQALAPVFVTLGSRGVLVSDPQWTLAPGVPIEGEIDPTGAGDSATAGCVLALAAGASCPEAAIVGNLAASITIEQLDTTGTARPEQLLERWKFYQKSTEPNDAK